MKRALLPPLLLVLYGLAFAWTALGHGLLVFDDHPGQLYRVAHAVTLGLAPWRLDPGWWAGYAELQYYPPGFAYAGALLHYASLGTFDSVIAYQVLVWITFLLPGVSTYLLLARVTGSAWLALPGAFVALTLSDGSRSGVEEGLRWGLVAARLGWGVLPLLALTVEPWTARRRPPLASALALSAIVLIHPAHAPAGVALLWLAAGRGPGSRRARLGHAMLLTVAGLGLAAFWLLPLLVHLRMALPLEWGEPTLASIAQSMAAHPLSIVLIAGAAIAWWVGRRSTAIPASMLWLADLPPALLLLIVVDAAVLAPSGLRWLPADRLLDSFLLALIWSSSVAIAILSLRWPGLPHWAVAALSIAIALALASPSRAEPSLSLWPRPWPNEWPTYDVVRRATSMDALWAALDGAPAGRVLFVRSGVPLESRDDWRRPHSHLTALTPLRTGRGILNGTFTHPSPLAGFFYTGSPAPAVTFLAEQRDGFSLFGRPLADVDAAGFNALVGPLRVSAVVALAEDRSRLGFVAGNPAFTGPASIGPFLVFFSREARPLPVRNGPQRWRLPVAAHAAGWSETGMAYSPLWRAEANGHALRLRSDGRGLLEVELPAGDAAEVELVHAPGVAEWSGLAVTSVCALVLAAVWIRRRVRP